MNTRFAAHLSIGAFVFLSLFLFPTHIVLAEECTGIAIVAGPWENIDAKTSYTVQVRDAAGAMCKVSQTLRLSFESTGSGSFTSESGATIDAYISKNTANRNFYYENTTGSPHTLTIKAGYESPGTWSVSHDTADTLSDAAAAAKSSSSDASHANETEQSATAVTQTSTTNSNSQSSTPAQARTLENDPLKLTLSHPKQVSVGQSVQFVATPGGLEETELRKVRFQWSFGDSGTSTSRTPMHVYTHPGTYVVIGRATRAEHEIVVRSDITVVSLGIRLEKSTAGDMLIRNTTSHEIEISGLVISDGTNRFTISEDTYLVSNASIALPSSVTGFSSAWSIAFVYDQNKNVLAQYPPKQNKGDTTSKKETSAGATNPVTRTAVSRESNVAGVVVGENVAYAEGVEDHEPTATPDTIEMSEETTPASRTRWRVPLAFAGVLLIGIVALYIHKIV